MSDQIAVLAEGRVEQVGPPQEIYSAPATTFVAGFLGAANIFDAEVLELDGSSAVCSALNTRLGAAVDGSTSTGPAAVVIRPERITLQDPDAPVAQGHNAIRGIVVRSGLPRLLAPRCTSTSARPSALIVEVPNASGPDVGVASAGRGRHVRLYATTRCGCCTAAPRSR